MAGEPHFCNCKKYCKTGKMISRASYDRHAPHRRSAAFAQFLSEAAARLNPLSGRSRKHRLEAGGSGTTTQAKQRRVDAASTVAEGSAIDLQNNVLSRAATEPPNAYVSLDASVASLEDAATPREGPDAPEIPSELQPLPDAAPETFPEATFPHGNPPVLPFHDATSVANPTSVAHDPGSLADLEARVEQDDSDEEEVVQEPLRESTLLSPDVLQPRAEDIPSRIEDIELTRQFIKAIESATLEGDNFDPDTLKCLRNPPQNPPDISDPDLRYSLDIFLATTNASLETYNGVRSAYRRRHGDAEMLSHDQIKRKVAELSGVTSLVHDMCINSCLAFTGPYSALDKCPLCYEPRYDQLKLAASKGKDKVPRQVFHTLPIGPQLQAHRRTPEMAAKMHHRSEKTREMFEAFETSRKIKVDAYEDFYHGRDFIDAVRDGRIAEDDTILMLSMDGAQLYQNKASDCWIYIWIVLSLSPDLRYKKKYILPGGFIPGPNKPKIIDSFLFPGLHHLSAIQREGLAVWDALKGKICRDHPFLAFAAADTPAMAAMDGMVGHHGRVGCRFYCAMEGRHKQGAPHYYPACLKPDDYVMEGCDHGDVSLRPLAWIPSTQTTQRYQDNLELVIRSQNVTQYKKRRLETGISKPSVFSGLPRFLGVPAGFPADLMHLVSLNLTDLLISLWRGTIECDRKDDKRTWQWAVLVGDVWKAHGRTVAAATPYLPGSFDRPPRNPAEKMTSGYKAWEFLLYIYGLGPAILYGVLPDVYWRNYCKLVFSIRLLHQRSITSDQLRSAQKALIEFAEEFELLYISKTLPY